MRWPSPDWPTRRWRCIATRRHEVGHKAVYTAQQAKRLDDSLLEVRAAMGQAYLATGETNEAIV